MATVIVILSVKPQDFPAGTVDPGVFEYDIIGQNHSAGQSEPTMQATFENVPPGDYTGTVRKLGVTASFSFTVPPGPVSLGVPDVVTVHVQ